MDRPIVLFFFFHKALKDRNRREFLMEFINKYVFDSPILSTHVLFLLSWSEDMDRPTVFFFLSIKL